MRPTIHDYLTLDAQRWAHDRGFTPIYEGDELSQVYRLEEMAPALSLWQRLKLAWRLIFDKDMGQASQ